MTPFQHRLATLALGAVMSTSSAQVQTPAQTLHALFDSEWERIMAHALAARGLAFTPQYPLAGRRLDFALFGNGGIKLDLEVDGRLWHEDIDGNRKLDDHWRDHQMRTLGWRVRRFWVDEIRRDMEHCLDLIERDLS